MSHAMQKVWYNTIFNHQNKVDHGNLRKKNMLIKSTSKYNNLEHVRNMVHVAVASFTYQEQLTLLMTHLFYHV